MFWLEKMLLLITSLGYLCLLVLSNFVFTFHQREIPDVRLNPKDLQGQTGWMKYISIKKKISECISIEKNIDSGFRFHDIHISYCYLYLWSMISKVPIILNLDPKASQCDEWFVLFFKASEVFFLLERFNPRITEAHRIHRKVGCWEIKPKTVHSLRISCATKLYNLYFRCWRKIHSRTGLDVGHIPFLSTEEPSLEQRVKPGAQWAHG